MSGIEALNALAVEFNRQKRIVAEECGTMAKAAALMAKWEETSFIEAVAREAKSRAIKALEITTGSPLGKYANGGTPYQHVQGE